MLVEHSAQQMFELVDAVERYPEFLPWCESARVFHRDAVRTRAALHLNYRGVRRSFTTENLKERPFRIAVALVEGPFRELDGEWRFTALAQEACRIDFRLHYTFSSRLLERLIGPAFGHVANTMVDAFVTRARKLHGG